MVKIRQQIINAKKIVVKVGTSSLVRETGNLNLELVAKLTETISKLQSEGRNVVLVTSGAIGVGMDRLGLKERPTKMKDKQAAAAVGQCELMSIYSKMFWEYEQVVAQILLTSGNVGSEQDRLNVINTFDALMQMNVVPIVNENDSVSTEEIYSGEGMAFNENDSLAAIVASLIKADLLVILSDIDGFYESDPKVNPDSKRISVIRNLTEEMEKFAGGAGSKHGTGGMITKLRAARIANEAGAHMILASGAEPAILLEIVQGKDIGSVFVSDQASGVS